MNLLRPFVVSSMLAISFAYARDNMLDPEAWPRTYWVGDAEVSIYPPKIVEWSELLHLKANPTVGPDAFVGKTAEGDVYVGKHGNLYKRDEGGGWQSAPVVPARTAKPEPATLPARQPVRAEAPTSPRDGYTHRQPTAGQLNRDAYSRQRSERPSGQRLRR